MILKRKKIWNRKGEGSVLVDYGATVFIVLIILIFFFLLKIKDADAIYKITGEQIGIDATTIALVYAQTPVETSQGTMTFAKFLEHVADDSTLKDELVTKTEEYFSNYCYEKSGRYIDVEIIFMKNKVEEGSIPFFPCKESIPYRATASPSHLIVPFHNPEHYAIINIRTTRE